MTIQGVASTDKSVVRGIKEILEGKAVVRWVWLHAPGNQSQWQMIWE